MTEQQLTEEQVRLAASDPIFIRLYNEALADAERRRVAEAREDGLKRQFEAIDFTARLQRYATYREMRCEFAEEDDWVSHYGQMPRADMNHYLSFKMQCLREPGYKI
jgi:hypothetical protein